MEDYDKIAFEIKMGSRIHFLDSDNFYQWTWQFVDSIVHAAKKQKNQQFITR